MSSKDVLRGALQNLLDIERSAKEVYRELYEELEDEELKEFIGELMKSEERHQRLVKEVLRLLKEE